MKVNLGYAVTPTTRGFVSRPPGSLENVMSIIVRFGLLVVASGPKAGTTFMPAEEMKGVHVRGLRRQNEAHRKKGTFVYLVLQNLGGRGRRG